MSKPDFNLNDIMSQAKKLQDSMMKAQQDLKEKKVIGKAGLDPDVVIAEKEGIQLKKISISDSLLSLENKEILEDMIVAAVNDATHNFETISRDVMSKLTANMGLPPDFKIDG
ncbi:MAG: Nucleoid-associated protein YbaB [Legionellaceae bacterium]